jgi:hypothetical protein
VNHGEINGTRNADLPLVSPRRDEDYGPVAPRPAWRDLPPHKQFNRERFLLRCVAWIIGVQFGLFILAGLACAYGYAVKLGKVTSYADQPVTCPRILEEIKSATADSLAVLLALLGGGALAVGEYQRRHPPERPQARLPEPEPWTPPPTLPRLDPRDPRNGPHQP